VYVGNRGLYKTQNPKKYIQTSCYILTTFNVASAQNFKNYEDPNVKGMSSN
jgi:hypothetical protein